MVARQESGGRAVAPLVAAALLVCVWLLTSPPPAGVRAAAMLGGGGQSSAVQLARGYAHLPQRFEPNRGQSDPRVDFLSHGRGYSLFLSHGDATLLLARHGGRATQAALRLHLAGARPGARASGAGPLPGRVTYLRGRHPSPAQAAIPTFRGVDYRGVYPGIDVRYYGSAQQLEYDFSLAPRADPSRIALEIGGARRIRLGADGGLRVHVAGGTLREQAPVAFQRIAGVRRSVAVRFVVRGDRVSFALGDYDRDRPLTIDPVVLVYSTFLGGSSTDFGQAIAVDAAGSAYVAGWTTSTDFPTTSGAADTTQNGDDDAFVAKLAPDGKSLAYATYLGGSNQDLGVGIAVDAAGSAYVTGRTLGSDFPTTSGALATTAPGPPADAFVTKLAPNGQSLVYSTYLGGNGQDNGHAIAVDAAGSAYVTGFTDSDVFPTTPGALSTTLQGTRDDFVCKLAPDGKSLGYCTYLGGSDDEGGYHAGIAVDAAGAAYVTDRTFSANFPTTAGAFDTTRGGNLDAFVSKLAPDGKSLAFSTYLGGSGDEDFVGGGIAVDAAGSAFVTGSTSSADFPTTAGAFDAMLGGSSDAFVTKVAPDGGSLASSTFLGGAADELGLAIAVGPGDDASVTGDTFSADFPTTGDAPDTTLGGSQDAYVTRLAADGRSAAFSTFLGGGDVEDAFGIAADAAGAIYANGATFSSAFPTTPGASDTTLGAAADAYVTKFGPADPPPAGSPPATSSTPTGPAPSPPVAPSAVVPAGCVSNKLILTDVFPRGGKTRLLGVAPRAAVGKRVRLVSAWNGKRVATAKVRPDQSFSAAAPLPPARLRRSDATRYFATLGAKRSAALKFARRMYTTAITPTGLTVVFAGTVTPPLARPVRPVVIRAAAACSAISKGQVVASVVPSSRGAFKAQITLPPRRGTVFLRAETKVRNTTRSRKTFPSYTLIRGLRVVG